MVNESKPNRRRLIFVLFWVALIFVTSSFVVTFDGFVGFVQGLSSNQAFKDWFPQFWTTYGLFVVKGWHATEYAILVRLCYAFLGRVTKWSGKKRIVAAFIFAVLFAASDEWHQTFVPGRDGCVRDVVIDSVGAAISAIWLKFRKRPLPPCSPDSEI